MSQLDLNSSVGNWVAAHPQTSRVFEALKIDYCCGGGKALEKACAARQLDPQRVIVQLEQAIQGSPQAEGQDWLTASLVDLCDHVEQNHHGYLKRELPRLAAIIDKVVNAHGASHPELATVQQAFAALRAELEPHMFKEERVLFPAIRLLEQSAGNVSFPFGSIANPINRMEHEHDDAGDALATIRRATHDFTVPGGACNTYRAMLSGLHELEGDMHQHVHKENNILFPRAIQLEAARVGAGA